MKNVTITLSAEYAAKAVADLTALRESDPAMTRYTPAVSVVLRRLEDALGALAPDPANPFLTETTRRAAGIHTGDVLDPCETQDAPPTVAIVTQPQDLDPTARYALWVCGLEGSHGRGVKCSGHSMRATGTGAEMAAVMGLYRHAYAEYIG